MVKSKVLIQQISLINYKLINYLIITSIIAISPNKAIASEILESSTEARTLISTKEEDLLGRLLRYKLIASGILNKNLILNEYIKNLANNLLIHVQQKNLNKFYFFAIDSLEPNAFTFMGGNIAIFYGLINLTENESELAAILAHEIGHVINKHITKGLIKQKRLLPITIIEAIGAIALGVPDLIVPILGGHVQQMYNFSRSQEKDADRVALEILDKSKFNPLSMAHIFERMDKLERISQQIPEYLLTHPILGSRAAAVYQKNKSIAYKQYQNSLDYKLVKAIIQIELANNKIDLLSQINQLIEKNIHQDQTILLFQKALLLKELHQPAKALKILEILNNNHPENLIINNTVAELYCSIAPNLAKNKLANLFEIAPDYLPITINYATLLLQLNLPLEAKKILTPLDKENINDLIEEPKIYELLISCYQKLDYKIESLLAAAKLMLISNRLNESEQKLNSAIKIATQMFPAKLYKVNQFKIELEQFKQDVIQVNKI